MSSVIHSDQESWEYRHRCIESKPTNPDALGCREQDPEFIKWLVETLESLDHAEEGWRLVRAKIESDERGHLWLDVVLKRPLADAQKIRGSSSIPHAA